MSLLSFFSRYNGIETSAAVSSSLPPAVVSIQCLSRNIRRLEAATPLEMTDHAKDSSTTNLPSTAPATVITFAIIGALVATIIGFAVYKLCRRQDPDGNFNVLDRAADRPKSQEERLQEVRKINRRYLKQLGFEAKAELRHALYLNERYSRFSSTTDGGNEEAYRSRDFDEVDLRDGEDRAQPFDFGFQAPPSRASTAMGGSGGAVRYSTVGNPWRQQRASTQSHSLRTTSAKIGQASSGTEPFPKIERIPRPSSPHPFFQPNTSQIHLLQPPALSNQNRHSPKRPSPLSLATPLSPYSQQSNQKNLASPTMSPPNLASPTVSTNLLELPHFPLSQVQGQHHNNTRVSSLIDDWEKTNGRV